MERTGVSHQQVGLLVCRLSVFWESELPGGGWVLQEVEALSPGTSIISGTPFFLHHSLSLLPQVSILKIFKPAEELKE